MNAPDSPLVWKLLTGLFFGLACTGSLPAQPEIRSWRSSADLKHRLTEAPRLVFSAGSPAAKGVVVRIDETRTFQTMLGMGSSLEPATCWNLSRLGPIQAGRVLQRLLDPAEGVGMNLMRICMGTPDFTGDPWYSYHDLPPGETDPELKRFSIEKDRRYILPMLKLARQTNPDLLFFASPWSPPGWMKSNGTMIGGRLLPQHYPAYAEYFVKFIQAYAAEDLPIYAVTVQNEPGVDRAKEKDPNWHYPSCHWTADEEREFIRDHLGPAFERHGIKTRIWCYDHNYNVRSRGDDPGIAYPRKILSDPRAARFVSGVAFHGYAGGPEGMSAFHEEFPGVPLYFTEGSVFGLKGAAELVDKLRNWASGYNAWVTLLDDGGKPNNGPFEASRTMITLNPARLEAAYHFDFYMSGQFTKFVQRGARRVESTGGDRNLAHVAFLNPDRTLVVVLVNGSGRAKSFQFAWRGKMVVGELPANTVTTCRWSIAE